MAEHLDTVLAGCRRESELPNGSAEQLQLFMDMVPIESIGDELECCLHSREKVDYADSRDTAGSLMEYVPWAGFF